MKFFITKTESDKKWGVSRTAFTLAEILITLGIIGIIAAMTIPNIISKINERVTIAQLKEAYSVFSQAIKMSEAENGELEQWDYGNSYLDTQNFINTYIAPYFKTHQYYGKLIWGADGSVLQKMGGFSKKCNGWEIPNGSCSGESGHQLYRLGNYPVATRVDVSQCYSDSNVSCSPKIQYVTFIIDINGPSGRGVMGKDIFEFTLFGYEYNSRFQPGDGKHYGFRLGGICGHHGCYTKSIEQLLTEGTCRLNNTTMHSGKDCGLVIQKNSWNIPKNYPIRF